MTLSNWWNRLLQRKIQAQRLEKARFRLEELETRCLLSVTGFRPIDEVDNQAPGSTVGTAGIDLIRMSDPPTAYANNFFTPSMGGNNPTFVAGPRLVSNILSNQTDVLFDANPTHDNNTVNQNGLSDFGYTFGQFMDHDMDLTPTLSGQITAASWSPDGGGTATITVADGLFQVGNAVIISGTPGFNSPGTPPTPFTILTATPPSGTATTFTFALATNPGTPTMLGFVTNNTTKDGSNGFPIPKDTNNPADPLAAPGSGGSLAFNRSVFDVNTGTPALGTVREQTNVNTAFLDLSQVYGSTITISNALRAGKGTSSGGRLLTSPGDLLPFDNTDYFTTAQIAAFNMANDVGRVSTDQLFAAGDVRANETTELTSLHTLFLRNHNRLAGQLAALHPDWNDEQLFQEARKLNIAEYQSIVYNGYLPAILGPTAIPGYNGYTGVDPSIANEFSTVGFRFGHSLLNNNVPRDANDGSSLGDLALVDSFFNPTLLTPGGVNSTAIDAILKGDADNNAQAMDAMAVSSIRNLLFGTSGFGEDLISRDVWRTHDNGIGTLNAVRAGYGLPLIPDTTPELTHGFADYHEGQPFHGFELLSSDPKVVTKLVTAYTGLTRDTVPGFLSTGHSAGDIDPFFAGIAEDHVNGSNLGMTFQAILVDQFSRLRDGDRFFYLNQDFNAEEQALLSGGNTLANVIKANTGVTNLQDDVFHFFTQQDGKTKGYYTNNNGQAELTGSQNGNTLTTSLYNSLVSALANPDHPGYTVLVDRHGDYVSASSLQSYSFVKNFLQNVDNDNVANKLSAQLLATEFNVLLGKVSATSSIYVPAIVLPPGSDDDMGDNAQQSLKDHGVSNPSGIANVQDLLNAAIASLRANPNTTDQSPDRVFQRALKGCFVAINNNESIFIA